MARKKIKPSGAFLLQAVIEEMADSPKVAEQIAYLREKAIPFIISGAGRPLVKVTDFYGGQPQATTKVAWTPRVLQA